MKYKQFWWILAVVTVVLLAWTGYDWWEAGQVKQKRARELVEREVVEVTPVPEVTLTPAPIASPEPVVYTSEFSRILDEKCVGEVRQEAIAVSDLPLTISPQVKDLYQIGEMVRCEGDEHLYDEQALSKYRPNTRYIAFGGSHYNGGNSLGFVQVAHPDSRETSGMGTGGEIFEVKGELRCVGDQRTDCMAIEGSEGEEWILEREAIGPRHITPSGFRFWLEASRTIGDGRGLIWARIFSAEINAWQDYPGLADILRKYGVTDQNHGFTEKMDILQDRSVEEYLAEQARLDQELLTEFAKSPLFEDMKQRMRVTLDGISFKN